MIEGLQTFDRLERLIENIDFLSTQNNILSASIEFAKLKTLVFSDDDIKQLLLEFGSLETYKKRVTDKQKQLYNTIT